VKILPQRQQRGIERRLVPRERHQPGS
jgi:hypothetical protein